VRPAVRAVAAILLLVMGFKTVRKNRGPAVRPWAILLMGGAVALGSAVIRLIHGAIIGVSYAYPSPADLLAYSAYGLMILGGSAFVRARTRERYRADLVDSVIVSVLGGLLMYAFVLSDYIVDNEIPAFDRLGNVAYSVMTVALIGVTARVSFGPGVRNGSYYLLAAAAGLIVLNDILLLLDTVGRPGAFTVASVIAPLAYFSAAGAILHPGALALADRPSYREQTLTTSRTLLLFAAMLSGPLLLLRADLRDSTVDIVVVLALWVILGSGVFLRLVLLVQDRERLTRQERSLRSLASRLTTLQSGQEAIASSLAAGLELAPNPDEARLSLIDVRDKDVLSVVAALGLGQERVVGAKLDPAGPAGVASEAAVTGKELALELVPPVEADVLSQDDSRDQFVALAPVQQRAGVDHVLALTSGQIVGREQVAGLASLAGQLGLALDSLELREQLHQRRSNRRFQALVENSSDVVLVVDESGLVGFVSPTVERLLGRPEEDVLGVDAADLLHRPDQLQLRRLLASPGRAGASTPSIQVRLRHGSGELRWFEIEASDLRDEGEVQGIVITASDVNDRKRAEAQLLRSEARFRLMVQNSSDVVAIVDENAIVSYVSPSIYKMLGFSPVEVLGRNVFELLSITEAERLRSAPMSNLSGSTVEVRIQGTDGQVHAVEVAITDMREQPEVDGIVLNIRDVTERKTLEDDLRHQALHDDLTGLPNRALFAERVKSAVRASGPTGELVAILFIDLDDFKLINDSLGHVVGDQVLVGIADRVQQTLRLSDMAARLGGDEFAVLLSGVYGESEITEVADRVREAIAQPIVIGDGEFELTASIGIAIAGGDHQPSDDLLRSADLAMYRAKQGGKNRSEIFEDYMEASVVEQLELKTALKRAVEHDEFVLHYQPIVDMATSRICGVEALIRWEDPNRGLISPASFIPVAEETGLINEIGMWVAKTAAGDLARWRASGHDLYCSVNVSGRQMSEEDFGAEFIGVIDASGVDPTAIVIELTESVLAVPGTNELFDAFHAKGFRIALDDFGTGYSALQYLQTFDIDLIKIDRSFVTSLGVTKDTSMVKAVLDVASSIDAQTIAEGIEDAGELHLLKDLGVDLGQGYYFSRPVPEPQLLKILANDASPIAVS
jgi:diguanylate cyclase (GGDEF)-like protein/PAS domain S-box-containing protein